MSILSSTPREKQQAAMKFINFATGQATTKWSQSTGYMPVRKSAANNEALKTYWSTKDPQGKQSYDAIGNSIPEPNVRGQQDIRDVITNMYVSVMTGKVR